MSWLCEQSCNGRGGANYLSDIRFWLPMVIYPEVGSLDHIVLVHNCFAHICWMLDRVRTSVDRGYVYVMQAGTTRTLNSMDESQRLYDEEKKPNIKDTKEETLEEFCIEVLQRSKSNRRGIPRNWLSWLWELSSPRSVRQPSYLGTQVRVDAAILSRKVGNSGRISRFPCSSLEAEFLLPWETSGFAQKTFDWLNDTHPHYGGPSAFLKVYWPQC